MEQAKVIVLIVCTAALLQPARLSSHWRGKSASLPCDQRRLQLYCCTKCRGCVILPRNTSPWDGLCLPVVSAAEAQCCEAVAQCLVGALRHLHVVWQARIMVVEVL